MKNNSCISGNCYFEDNKGNCNCVFSEVEFRSRYGKSCCETLEHDIIEKYENDPEVKKRKELFEKIKPRKER